MNEFDASYFGSSISEAQIADPHREVSVQGFAIEGQLPLSCKHTSAFFPCKLVFIVGGYE
jgi:hypothetical protein